MKLVITSSTFTITYCAASMSGQLLHHVQNSVQTHHQIPFCPFTMALLLNVNPNVKCYRKRTGTQPKPYNEIYISPDYQKKFTKYFFSIFPFLVFFRFTEQARDTSARILSQISRGNLNFPLTEFFRRKQSNLGFLLFYK